MPFHIALPKKDSSKVLGVMLAAYLKRVEVQGIHGFLPLHNALIYKAFDNVSRILFQASTKAVEVKMLIDALYDILPLNQSII